VGKAKTPHRQVARAQVAHGQALNAWPDSTSRAKAK
jgi:hypothetical protein